MAGENITISTYRLSRDAGTGKKTFSGSKTLDSVLVSLGLERIDKAIMIDQDNAHNIYRIQSDDDLDIQRGDKVVDVNSNEYRVHTVQKDIDPLGRKMTLAILKIEDVPS